MRALTDNGDKGMFARYYRKIDINKQNRLKLRSSAYVEAMSNIAVIANVLSTPYLKAWKSLREAATPLLDGRKVAEDLPC